MRRLPLLLAATVLAAGGAIVGPAHAKPALQATPGYTYVQVDHPLGAQETILTSFGPNGDLVGTYEDANSVFHGFIRRGGLNGPDETIDFPGGSSTYALDENAKGDVSGTYLDAAGKQHGFIRSKAGKFRSIDIPGAGTSDAQYEFGTGLGTLTGAIADDGSFAGAWGTDDGYSHGYLMDKNGKRIDVDHPLAARKPRLGVVGGGTSMVRTNKKGDAVGIYVTSAKDDPLATPFGFHGFIRHKDGSFENLDPIGSHGSSAFAITDDGTVGGFYADGFRMNYHAFLWKDGAFTTIDPFVGAQISTIADIAPDGRILGEYYDAATQIHGWVGIPTKK